MNPANVPAYRIGTLLYSKAGLIALFGWLLWGDFVFVLMEAIYPALMPVLLKDHGASNWEVVIIATTLHTIMNALVNPVVSYKSDHCRSRWGRRRPFIIVTTPFVVLFLALIPFAPEISHHLSSLSVFAWLFSLGPVAPIILTFGFLAVGFQFFNMFVASVYYYLIPDVVPTQFIGRFIGLFRMVGAGAGIVFHYFIFGHAESHMKLIFVSIALIYGVCILLMCAQVKEGDYPPIPLEEKKGAWDGVKKYATECFGHRYYWWAFCTYSASGWGAVGGVFAVFFFRDELGFSLELIGKTTAWSSALFILAAYPFGILMDRWGCHKTVISTLAILTLTSVCMFFFAVDKTSGIVWLLVRNLAQTLFIMSLGKWTVEVYPRDRYGQFGSAGALFSSLGATLLAPACAWWIDAMHEYRFLLVWSCLFTAAGVFTAIQVYRQWKLLGGPHAYQAP